MKLLDTKTGLEGQGSKVNSEQHGKPGKRGKMKLLDTKTGLEGQGSKVKSEQHGKPGKAWKNEAPGHQNRARDQGVQKHNMERVEKDFSLSLGRVFQLSTLY